MRKFLLAAITFCCLATNASGDSCSLPPLQSTALPYAQGGGVPVITGPYKFNLPAKPNAFLAVEGVMAVYPDNGYVSYQFVKNENGPDTLSRFTTREFLPVALDRYLYGLDPIHDLNVSDQQHIEEIHANLNLDCHAQLTLYHVGRAVDVIFQEATQSDPEYRMLYFSEQSSHLISVKGSRETAVGVLQSIKERKF